jgi:hypothetical protein
LPLVSAKEEAAYDERVFIFLLAKRSHAPWNAERAVNLYIAEFLPPVCKSLLEHFRNSSAALEINAVSTLYALYGFRRTNISDI